MGLTTKMVFVLLLALPTAAGVQRERHSAIDPEAIAAAQKCLNWCWAAGAEMLLRSQGVYIPQEELVARVYGPELPCLPTFGRFEPIRQAVTGTWTTSEGSTVQITGAYNDGLPTNPAGMIQSIDSGRPFLFAYGGHIYVAYGLFWYEPPSCSTWTRHYHQGLVEREIGLPIARYIPRQPQVRCAEIGTSSKVDNS